MEELKNIIASNIASLRKINGMTQAELAEKLCYSDKAISKWERGESIPDVIVLKQVSDLFSVTVDYLLTEHDGSKPAAALDTAQKKKNRTLISAVSAGSVWFFATALFIAFILLDVTIPVGNWMIFVYAVPAFLTVALVFNCIWGTRNVRAVIVSLLMWSVLGSVCLTFRDMNLWLLFVIGAPAQVIILLSFGIGRKTNK